MRPGEYQSLSLKVVAELLVRVMVEPEQRELLVTQRKQEKVEVAVVDRIAAQEVLVVMGGSLEVVEVVEVAGQLQVELVVMGGLVQSMFGVGDESL